MKSLVKASAATAAAVLVTVGAAVPASATAGNYFAKYISCTVYKDNPFEKEVQFHAAVRGGTTPVTVTARANEDDGYVLGLPATLPAGNSDYTFFQYVPADVTTAVVTEVDFAWEDGATGTFPVVFDPTNAPCSVVER